MYNCSLLRRNRVKYLEKIKRSRCQNVRHWPLKNNFWGWGRSLVARLKMINVLTKNWSAVRETFLTPPPPQKIVLLPKEDGFLAQIFLETLFVLPVKLACNDKDLVWASAAVGIVAKLDDLRISGRRCLELRVFSACRFQTCILPSQG